MNTVPRPLQVTEPRDYYADLTYTALLGGDTITVGPFKNPRDRDRAIASARASLPGEHHPAARRYDTPKDTA